MAKASAKPQPKPEKKTAPAKEIVLTPLIPEPLAKKLFIGFAVALFLLMVTVSHQFGISGDENFHRVYGHHVFNFYATLGHDRTAVDDKGVDSLMVFYGGFYDGTATALAKSMPMFNEWDVRHFWNSIFGFVAMLGAGLVAVEIAGWQAGLITLIFMAFSPRFFGESMNNPKDITMATGYMLSYVFLIKFLKQLPQPTLKTTLGLGASIGVAMGIRIGGLLLIPYTFMFYGLAMLHIYGFGKLFDFSQFKENVWPSFKYVLLASAMGYCLSLLFWPYGMVGPFTHPFEVLSEAEKYPVQIRILFDGKHIPSTEVPWNYIPQWLFISTPLFGLIGLALSVILIPYMQRKGKLLLLGFMYFSLVFPIAYVIYKKSVLYDTMRHFFFVYPSIIILAGLAFDYIISYFSKNIKYAVAAVIVVLVLLPARFMFANHPNEYVYFNELEGGIKGAYGYYETDYYMNSVKQCADWLKAHENLKRPDGKLTTIYTNAVAPTTFYFKPDSNIVSVGYASYRQRNDKDADYEIMYCRFVDRDLLLHGAFPPEQAVYTVYADGIPLSCVIKVSDKGAYVGQELMGKGDYAGAVAVLEPYVQKYPKNELALANLGLCYLNVQRFADAQRVLSQSLALDAENTNGDYWLGLAYFYQGNFSQAANILTGVVKRNPYFPPPYRVLSDCMARLGDQNGASYYAGIYRQLADGGQQ
ncbi:MAG TPA: tetratricopeptide repeat protein [Chitinophagales bacterium]|nr:tetratricopeptide repeat protein [Chitinophagales bacterium]